MKLTPDDIKRVKAQGFLKNRGTEDRFSARVLTKNSVVTAEELERLAEAARRFGNGKAVMTTRLTVEIPGIAYESIEEFQGFLSQNDLHTGGTGDKIRPVTACKGTTCVFGQLDTQGVAQRIHEQFYEGWRQVALPHKFKIAVGGCPNNCMKPDLNDFGLVGVCRPEADPASCRVCKSCIAEQGCQMDALRVNRGVPSIDRDRCNACGKCTRTCPFGGLRVGKQGLRVLLGGKWGRERRPATPLEGIWSEEEAFTLLEKSLLCYRKHGYQKERFGDMIDRIGVEAVVRELLGDALLAEREAILAAPITPRP